MDNETDPEPLSRMQIMGGLLPEFGSTQFVLGTGIRLLREAESFARDKDAIFATLAVGVEKVVKLSLGIMALDAGKAWPTKDIWGHDSARMDAQLRDALRARIEGGGFTPYVRSLLCTVDGDAVWAAVVEALDIYASEGRFYNLDVIGGRTQKRGNPDDAWDRAEHAALAADPSLVQMMQSLDAGFEKALSNAIADSIHRWLAMVTLLGMNGVLGDDWGKKFGADLLPEGATRVAISAACAAD